MCFQALAEHEHCCCPPDSPRQQQFWGDLPILGQPCGEEQRSPTTRAHKPRCIPCCWCLGASRSSAASKNHPAGSKAVGNMDTRCPSLVLLGKKKKKEAKRAVVRCAGTASHRERPLDAPSPSRLYSRARPPTWWQLWSPLACSAPRARPKPAVLTIYCKKAVGGFSPPSPGVGGRWGSSSGRIPRGMRRIPAQ